MKAKINPSQDCGNSPKNLFVQDLSIALATADVSTILDSVTEDIRWDIVGKRLIQGKEALAEALEEMGDGFLLELTVQHVATHGKAGAVNGVADLQGGKTRAFCDVYEFSNTRGAAVREINSYWIETGD